MSFEFYRVEYNPSNDSISFAEIESKEYIKTKRKVNIVLNRNAMLELLIKCRKFEEHLMNRGKKCQFCGKTGETETITDNETLTDIEICKECLGEIEKWKIK